MEYKNIFLQAVIYLVAAIVSVPIAKRLGFGSVLGYLIAGILIGPFALGLIGQDSKNIMQFSQFGVVMMLFLIGLELRPSLLWKLRSQIVGTGLLQVAGTTVLLTTAFVLLDFPLLQSVAIGMILSLSSTAIVIQIFTEKGWMQTSVGQSSFSILLFQDIAVIPIMFILPWLGSSTSHGALSSSIADKSIVGWLQPLIVIACITLLIGSGRYLLRSFFRYIAKAKIREIFTATALLVVIASALFMQSLGLSPALGTFLAGVMLAESEYRHELESDIEPFKGLLLGLFFIAVGAGINLDLVMQNPYLILKVLLVFILLKAVFLYAIAKIYKMSTQNGLLFAASLAQGGEFCFVLLSFSLEHQILPEALTDILIVVVALSMLITPLIILCYEKFLVSRFAAKENKKEYDEIDPRTKPVVIAGFGRFGQIVGRLLMAHQFKITVLDLDSEHIELVRKFGYKIFYGDASRIDLLHTAGLDKAKVFIIAIDDSEKALETAKLVRQHYPNLKILIRVRGRVQAYEFLKNDFTSIYREVLDSALTMGVDALQILGLPYEKAAQSAKIFRQYDESRLVHLSKIYQNEQDYIDETKKNRKYLEQVFNQDKENVSIDPAFILKNEMPYDSEGKH